MNKPDFNTSFKNFKRRTPKSRLGDKIDTTHIRFVDTATKEELIAEYELIKEKRSKLSRSERDIIKSMFE